MADTRKMNLFNLPAKITSPDARQRSLGWLMPLSLAVALLAWELFTQVSRVPSFILPSPSLVWERLVEALLDGELLRHSLATLSEVILGLLAGAGLAILLGYWLTRLPGLERIVSPYIVASQSVPVVAIAPLLVIWFGPGMLSKVLICALVVFFPVLVNTVVGLRSTPSDLRNLMRSLQATRWQTFRFLEMPAALPVLLGGLRIGATLSVIGAVVGEFIGADRGLGFMINRARGSYDTPLVFVAVFTLALMALTLYGVVAALEKNSLKWRD